MYIIFPPKGKSEPSDCEVIRSKEAFNNNSLNGGFRLKGKTYISDVESLERLFRDLVAFVELINIRGCVFRLTSVRRLELDERDSPGPPVRRMWNERTNEGERANERGREGERANAAEVKCGGGGWRWESAWSAEVQRLNVNENRK
ncbi:MAG: hypothetical protein ACTS45_01955 [Candidatus Hodgkinia cicadicola]